MSKLKEDKEVKQIIILQAYYRIADLELYLRDAICAGIK